MSNGDIEPGAATAESGVGVLAFGPHPDDVKLFDGATLIRLVDLGPGTGVVDLKRGELASHGIQMRHRMAPSFILDTSAAAQQKRRAIACYASRVARRPNDVPSLLSSAGALEAIEARDRFCGSMIGTSRGEPLSAPNIPGRVHPVAHFRHNAFAAAHAFEALR